MTKQEFVEKYFSVELDNEASYDFFEKSAMMALSEMPNDTARLIELNKILSAKNSFVRGMMNKELWDANIIANDLQKINV